MVNEVILNYLKQNKDKYELDDLKKEILSKGYSQAEFDSALVQIKASEPKKFEPGSLHKLPTGDYVTDSNKGNVGERDFGLLKLILILIVISLFGFGVIVLFNFFDIPFFGFNIFDFFS